MGKDCQKYIEDTFRRVFRRSITPEDAHFLLVRLHHLRQDGWEGPVGRSGPGVEKAGSGLRMSVGIGARSMGSVTGLVDN